MKFIKCKDRRTAKRRFWWAARIVKVQDGYAAFEYMTEYRIWKGQK